MRKLLQTILCFFICLYVAAQNECQSSTPMPKGIAARLTELSARQLEVFLQRMNVQLGAAWLRMDFPWNEIQSAGPTSYNVASIDRVVAAAAKYNVSILGVITYCPYWANGNQDQFYPPLVPQNYSQFASYLATRYAPRGVHYWEIWNAPNLGGKFWKPSANPAAYTKLLKLAYAAIKKADPKAVVILGGLVPASNQPPTLSPVSFLTAVYRNSGKAFFDAVGVHPFTYPALPNATDGSAYGWTQMYSGATNLRSIMTARRDGAKKIWMTSYGAPTNNGGNRSVSEAMQAQMVEVAYSLVANYSWAGPLFWYTYKDSGIDPSNPEDWFGLVRYDGTEKPSLAAFKEAGNNDCKPPARVNTTYALGSKGIATRLTQLTASQLESAMQRLKVLGATWLRMDFPWSEIQYAGPTSYDVAAIDQVVAAAVRYNIRVLGVIDYCPPWANGNQDQFYPPLNPQDYANFASYLATRYGPRGVHHWEIWNEPNLGGYFWKPAADPMAYTRLLKLAYAAIKQADPSAIVISGGLSPAGDEGATLTPMSFLAAVYQAGGRAYFDAVGHHPYTFPALATSTDGSAYWWTQMYCGPNNLRSIMVANGDGAKQIWMTEYGAPTNGGGGKVTEAVQAQMVTAAYKLRSNYTWAGPLFWYTYQDSGTDVTNPEDWFGLLRYDGSEKPAFAAFQSVQK